MAENYGVGIVGAGWVSGEYVKAFRDHPLTHVVGMYNKTPDKATRLMKSLGVDGKEFSSVEELLDDKRIDMPPARFRPHEDWFRKEGIWSWHANPFVTWPDHPAADALAFAPLVDHILVVVRAGSTSMQDVKKSLQLLPKEKIIGLVLNRQDFAADPYGLYFTKK